jgi:hypothetical protein
MRAAAIVVVAPDASDPPPASFTPLPALVEPVDPPPPFVELAPLAPLLEDPVAPSGLASGEDELLLQPKRSTDESVVTANAVKGRER